MAKKKMLKRKYYDTESKMFFTLPNILNKVDFIREIELDRRKMKARKRK